MKQKIKKVIGEKNSSRIRSVLNTLRIIKNIICWFLIVFLAFAVITFVVTKIKGETPTVFGYSINRVVSGSMEPAIEIGDVIINKAVTDITDLKVGDIITFQGDSRFDNNKVTHRIIVAPYDDGTGNIVLVTKGDANKIDDGVINASSVESKYLMKIGVLRFVYNIFFSQWGLLIFIFLLILIFFDEIVNIVRIIIYNNSRDENDTIYDVIERVQKAEQEEEKERQIADEKANMKKQAKLDAKKQREQRKNEKKNRKKD